MSKTTKRIDDIEGDLKYVKSTIFGKAGLFGLRGLTGLTSRIKVLENTVKKQADIISQLIELHDKVVSLAEASKYDFILTDKPEPEDD